VKFNSAAAARKYRTWCISMPALQAKKVAA